MIRNRTTRNRTLLCTAVAILAAAMLATNASAREGEGKDGPVRLLRTVPIPGTPANTTSGKMYVFDISFVDQTTQTYYLADRSNAVVDVVDARTNELCFPAQCHARVQRLYREQRHLRA